MQKKYLWGSIICGALLLVLGGAFFWWSRQSSQHAGDTEQNVVEQSQSSGVTDAADEEDTPETLGSDPEDGATFSEPDTPDTLKEKSAYVVDSETCSNECIRFEGDAEGMRYCRAACGLADTPGTERKPSDNCDILTETAKDICLRDKAVAEKSAQLCESIEDKTLRGACRNRIAEEYFDN
jgi:hypothetical protein